MVVAESKRGRKCKDRLCFRRGSGSGEDDYETCDEFCERREREKQREMDEQRACSSRRGVDRIKDRIRGSCRGGSKDRKGSKERQTSGINKQRERDCGCEERRMVSLYTIIQ